MTNTAELRQRVAIAGANLDRIAADLTLAQDDVALLERLKSAEDRVKRLTADHAKAAAEHEKAKAAEAKAAEEGRFADFSDIDVRETSDAWENVVRSAFTITFTRLTWDMRTHRSVMKEHTVGGFGTLPPEALDYLIEKHPGRIPAKIMDLAPESPREAINRYFRSVRRGHIGA